MDKAPTTLIEAVQYFADQDRCIEYLAMKRWGKGPVVCPTCGSEKVGYLAKQRRAASETPVLYQSRHHFRR
jgi:DNA-directed RNA polymerase subunit M/transcription elongation factor TFIIS